MNTKSGGGSPPLLPEADRFNGSNYTEWSETILMACRVCGARGYLDGTIRQPPNPFDTGTQSLSPGSHPTPKTPSKSPPPIAAATPQVETPWTSYFPSWEEWDARDAWCLLAICQNVVNPVGLGLKTNGSAAEAWKSIKDQYHDSSDLARVYAQRELRGTHLNDGDDFIDHLSKLHTLHKRANAVGASIADADFREIVLASLPSSWDTMISGLDPKQSLVDTLIRLKMHWARVNRNTKPTTPGTSAIALKATARSEAYQKKQCTNCKRKGHLVTDCYWKGGGKEGQFPPGFGSRGGATGSAVEAATTPHAQAAIVETTYALSAMMRPDYDECGNDLTELGDIVAEIVMDTTTRTESNHCVELNEGQGATGDDKDEIEVVVEALVAKDSGSSSVEGDTRTATYADSGASNHCFTNKTDFSLYIPFDTLKEGQAAGKQSKFKIHGKGTVTKRYISEGKQTKLTFTNALYTPDFAANLVSISQFDEAGFEVKFGGGKARIIDPKGVEVLAISKVKGMYVFKEVEEQTAPIAMPAKSHEHPTDEDGWHRRSATLEYEQSVAWLPKI